MKMDNFGKNKDTLNRELEQFITTLNKLLPRYSFLLKKHSLNKFQLKELGEIEHFLIEINAKITEIKNMLDHDLFGHSIDLYYKIKTKAKAGDFEAKLKLEKLRDTFNESLRGNTLMIWN